MTNEDYQLEELENAAVNKSNNAKRIAAAAGLLATGGAAGYAATNIPAGKKVKSVKVVDETQTNSISLTGKGNSTWTLASMPGYNVNMVVEYEDDDQFLTGRFSVAADKQVTFSPGNLQYKASTSIWAFAENQYDFVGSDNANISSTYDGWIDLFGWGTSGYNDKQPYMTSDTDYDYGDGTNDLTGTNYDWGAYASISNGGNMDWRTLSAAEWDYLLQTRDGAASKHGNATVAGNKGLVLLPDKWQLPEGLSFTADPTDWTTNTYTADQWAKMEAAGAVFLPASGRRAPVPPPAAWRPGERSWRWRSDPSRSARRPRTIRPRIFYRRHSGPPRRRRRPRRHSRPWVWSRSPPADTCGSAPRTPPHIGERPACGRPRPAPPAPRRGAGTGSICRSRRSPRIRSVFPCSLCVSFFSA